MVRHVFLALLLADLLLVSSIVLAQSGDWISSGEEIEEITITGSRRVTRSPSDVAAPVDIIGDALLSAQASTDMSDMIRTLIPSFNVGVHPISGTSTTVRPPSLRGLGPDHVLVLVDGKRRHRAADIPTFSGGISDGSQGPDISSIPAIALKQVQVLRDGAAAQYGSDAIAGVVNFLLNDAPEGGTLEAKVGEYYSGDGEVYQVAASYGFPINQVGFIRLSGEFRESDPTDRSVQRADANALIVSGNMDVADPAQIYGSPKITDNFKTFVNIAVERQKAREFYAFGGYSERRTVGGFFFRNPQDRKGIFTSNGSYLIGDMRPEDGKTCDGGIDFGGTGVVNNPIVIDEEDADSRLAEIFSDANCFSFLEFFPGGYTPLFGSDLTDAAGVMGLRGVVGNGMTYDISFAGGRNELSFDITSVVNPSFGSRSPTTFNDLGSRIQFEKNINLDISFPFIISGLTSPLNLAAGFEWRSEQFEVRSGEPISYEAGILANQGFIIGEEAFPGFSPTIAGEFDRENIAFYIDLEADITDDWLLGVALRHEDFNDFGHETTYKLSGLFKLTDALGIRATYTTGFHAPTPGQQNFSNLTSVADAEGNLFESGIIPPTNPIAMSKGGEQMRPEASKSFAVGLVYDSDTLNMTLDYYTIKMEDRITQTGDIMLTDAERNALIEAGIPGASNISTFRFFTNDFDSETKGIDFILTVPVPFGEVGSTTLNLAVNWTETEVTSFDPNNPNELLSVTRVIQLEKNTPRIRGNISFNYIDDQWRLLVRGNYYGSFTEAHINSGNLIIEAGPQVSIDFETSYKLSDQFDIVLGVENLFDSFPDRNPWGSVAGSKYPTTAPGGFNGGFYYGKIKYTF